MKLKDALLIRQGFICPYCNFYVYNKTKEHIIPRAIYKWTKEYLSTDEFLRLHSIIESQRNLLVVCESCNVNRGLSNISLDHLLPEDKQFIEPIIDLYYRLLEEAMSNQDYKCYMCGEVLQGTIYPRRINPNERKVVENCKVLCSECNLNLGNNRRNKR